MCLINIIVQDVNAMCVLVGMVTAEMFQSKQGTDVMSKMVEDLDEVRHLAYSSMNAFPCSLLLLMTYLWFFLNHRTQVYNIRSSLHFRGF